MKLNSLCLANDQPKMELIKVNFYHGGYFVS